MPRRFAPRNDGFGIYATIPSRVGGNPRLWNVIPWLDHGIQLKY
ncbi:hypothetical protein RFEPED_1519 [Rickettsia felis str. Pedreira]|uniref:Uncharacterized protein n=1 Tax=Rickettsia felis str. Pedreira TaxID=1359196 RepID=A0A0F3MX52_RICFI|nr:hypothetical protein [Rickettsia felis]KJV59119.1 hypothetical protein RFEPED_1519 [Rickettsia felis str. Pedreira]